MSPGEATNSYLHVLINMYMFIVAFFINYKA